MARQPLDTAHQIQGVVFSKDRPMQLDLALRSFDRFCEDAGSTGLTVLFAASTERFRRQFDQLQAEHPRVRFVPQRSFRRDLRSVLGLRWRDSIGGAVPPYTLLLVDDSVFIRPFRLAAATSALGSEPRAIGFSLRLGRNINYCYPLDLAMDFPPDAREADGVVSYEWPGLPGDLGYPLEVSSSVYRTRELGGILRALRFHDPNTLEGRLAASAGDYRASRPVLLCFARSVAFSNPMNQVQTTAINRSGNRPEDSVEALADRFDQGYRFDIEPYVGFVPSACHQLFENSFVRGGVA